MTDMPRRAAAPSRSAVRSATKSRTAKPNVARSRPAEQPLAVAPAPAPDQAAAASGAEAVAARERMLDEIEALLFEKAHEGQLTAIMFILKTLGAARGYGVVRGAPAGASGGTGLPALPGLGFGLGGSFSPDQLEAALRAIEDAC